jgi:hypothetical protein
MASNSARVPYQADYPFHDNDLIAAFSSTADVLNSEPPMKKEEGLDTHVYTDLSVMDWAAKKSRELVALTGRDDSHLQSEHKSEPYTGHRDTETTHRDTETTHRDTETTHNRDRETDSIAPAQNHTEEKPSKPSSSKNASKKKKSQRHVNWTMAEMEALVRGYGKHRDTLNAQVGKSQTIAAHNIRRQAMKAIVKVVNKVNKKSGKHCTYVVYKFSWFLTSEKFNRVE